MQSNFFHTLLKTEWLKNTLPFAFIPTTLHLANIVSTLYLNSFIAD